MNIIYTFNSHLSTYFKIFRHFSLFYLHLLIKFTKIKNMKTTSLDFFSGFKCIADKCKHNCCLKWQIDIDNKSLKHYYNIKNKKRSRLDKDFINRLESEIDFDNSTFKMKGDRCAFLDDDNLCLIYKNLGEKSLCQVCSDHPRYRNYFNRKIEMGISIACEVIADKVINYQEKAKEIVLKKGFSFRRTTKLEKEIIEFRKTIYDILQNRDINFSSKIDTIFSLVKIDTNKLYNLDIKDTLLSLEILDEKWKEKVDKICDIKSSIEFIENYPISFEQLGVYFIHKHLANSYDKLDIFSRTAFAIISLLIIANITKNIENSDKNTLIDVAREYSEEIEYNTENVNSLLDIIDDILIK